MEEQILNPPKRARVEINTLDESNLNQSELQKDENKQENKQKINNNQEEKPVTEGVQLDETKFSIRGFSGCSAESFSSSGNFANFSTNRKPMTSTPQNSEITMTMIFYLDKTASLSFTGSPMTKQEYEKINTLELHQEIKNAYRDFIAFS